MQCYQRILTLDPENVQGLHNLCVVYVERGDLLRAEKCFIRASQLAPHEEYIVRHLKIVQQRINKLTSVVNQNSPTKSVMQKSQNEFDDTFDVDHVDDATTEDGASDQNHPENDNSNDVNFGDNGSSKNYMPNTEKIFP